MRETCLVFSTLKTFNEVATLTAFGGLFRYIALLGTTQESLPQVKLG